MRILLAEDDTDLVEMITYALRRRGHTIVAAADGEQALQRWRQDNPSLMILDIGLPGVDGLEVCRQVREESQVPIIIISGASTEEDLVRGFQAGADQYVGKPFSITQLCLRIDAVTRRTPAAAVNDFDGTIQMGDLVINPEFCAVHRNGGELRLTRMEFRILYCLAANAGKVVVTEKLADFAWQGIGEGDPSLLKTHISRIRRKLGLPPNQPGFIRSVPGLGYSLTAT
ncbi:MAG: response regulator transcription factor [Dehalococcoidia bacterium]